MDTTTANPPIHVPKTRKGGVFTDAKDVNLHANDFGWSDVMSSLTAERKSLVDQYLTMCVTALVAVESLEDKNQAPVAHTTCVKGDEQAWETHFSASQHHFPLKNYIIHAFPVIKRFLSSDARDAAILECGCGTGSTLLPLMRECQNDTTMFVGFDVSASAVAHFSSHELAAEMSAKGRLVTFAHNITQDRHARMPGETSAEQPEQKKPKVEEVLGVREKIALHSPRQAHVKFDAILLVFVLCALPSVQAMVDALRSLAALLKPDGVLLFRDYALPDHNFFRFLEKRENKLDSLFFRKGDATSQFFFEKEFTAKLFAQAGLVEDESHVLTYHCNRIENRKNGKRMDKIFINGTFRLRCASPDCRDLEKGE